VAALSPIHRRRPSRAQILLPRWDKQTVSGERVDEDWWGDDWFVWSDDWFSDGEEERAMTNGVFGLSFFLLFARVALASSR
jgi:hypothetical protein